ncbi:hypothetical protein BESB_073760 [Besnoitia besnoiti]|uniref:Protein kinase domain-containing protein n=1 Tax=Besnoitia besnoiti TaxID=94643 RepID=A0A2A9MAJ7_BESBE|nr:uncharacterized protein BESB_073760 [Besnoitia besnoiti]PFH34224.1 hypothetical protein BESB_073760 [Besnoitia besnoiti]
MATLAEIRIRRLRLLALFATLLVAYCASSSNAISGSNQVLLGVDDQLKNSHSIESRRMDDLDGIIHGRRGAGVGPASPAGEAIPSTSSAGPSSGSEAEDVFTGKPLEQWELLEGRMLLEKYARFTKKELRQRSAPDFYKRAIDLFLPPSSVIEVVKPDGTSEWLRRGDFLGSGGVGIVCEVQRLPDTATALPQKLAAKFYFHHGDTGTTLTQAEAALQKHITGEMEATNMLLEKKPSEELHGLGVGVAFGVYHMKRGDGYPPVQRTEVLSDGQLTTVFISTQVTLMPVFGPDMFDIRIINAKKTLLKAVFYDTVLAVANLNMLGYVHGDLKPENLVVDLESGQVKLIDLTSVTPMGSCRPDAVHWTVMQTSPERLRAAFAGQTHHPSEADDAWALGITLFQMLTNYEHPYSTEASRKDGWDLVRLLIDSIKPGRFQAPDMAVLGLSARETRMQLLEIVKLLTEPNKEERWTPRKLMERHPFFQVVDTGEASSERLGASSLA